MLEITREDRYKAEVEGDIENVNDVLRITQIRARYHLKLPVEQVEAARGAFSSYLRMSETAKESPLSWRKKGFKTGKHLPMS